MTRRARAPGCACSPLRHVLTRPRASERTVKRLSGPVLIRSSHQHAHPGARADARCARANRPSTWRTSGPRVRVREVALSERAWRVAPHPLPRTSGFHVPPDAPNVGCSTPTGRGCSSAGSDNSTFPGLAWLDLAWTRTRVRVQENPPRVGAVSLSSRENRRDPRRIRSRPVARS